ncbi:MAG TPA: hypothetical protein DCG75_02625 [Bacteroidales bacterium]|nr:hypothetical protein [Bacteroidales bacterium]
MKCKIVKLDQFSGDEASVYSIYLDKAKSTLFEEFMKENIISFKSELIDIVKRLKVIGSKTGARGDFFKFNEGDLSDGICALYDEPDSKLRLYCIRYGNDIIILGGGGEKPKNIKAFQENEKLEKENYLLREISKEITKRIKNKDITRSENYLDFEGELEFDTAEYE